MAQSSWSYLSTPSLQGLLQQLSHLSQFGASALVVEGEEGSGKTTLLGQLHEQLASSESNETPLLMAGLSVSRDSAEPFSVLAQLAAAFGIEGERLSDGELIARLRSFVQALFREKQLAIALIDDADNIDSQELGALLSLLQQDGDATYGLKCIFCAKSGFASELDELGLVDLAIYDFQMPVFSAQEIESLVSAALPEYAQEAEENHAPSYSALWSRSRGNPGVALNVALGALNAKNDKGLGDDIRKMPVLHLVVVSVLLAVLLFLFFYGRSDEESEKEARSQRVLTAESLISSRAKEDKASGADKEAQGVSQTILANADLEATENTDADTEDARRVPNFVQDTSDPGSTSSDGSTSGALGRGQDIPLQDNGGAIFREQDEPTAEDAESGNGEEDRPQETNAGSSQSKPERSSSPVPEPSLSENLSADEARLISLSDDEYILQLLAATQKSALEEFIARQSNRDSMLIYRKRRDQASTWYVVVIGPFPGKAEAQRAILSLPDAQKKSGPWPKTVAAVKQEIRAYHGN